jgi:hypothetical protein
MDQGAMMNYYYDTYGNVTTTADPNRATQIAPPTCSSGQQPNWTGSGWACVVFSPPATSVASLGTQVTPLAFSNRFGTSLVALYTAAQTNAQLQIFKDQMWGATFIDLASPVTIAGINQLVSLSLLTQATATAILTNPVQENELPS